MLLLYRATVLFYIVTQAVDLFIHNVTFKNIYYNFYLWFQTYYYLCFLLLFYVTVLFNQALHLDILFVVLHISLINVLICY